MGVVTERKVTRKHVVPDTTAQIFWLKNRRPKEWRDKVALQDDTQISKLDQLIAGIDRMAKS